MIDEKKLIEWAELVRDDYKNCLGDYDSADVVQYIIDGIIKQPKVGEWIPCSERFPEKSGNYLVTSKGITWVAKWFNYTWWGIEKNCRWTDVEAWMPLPEPYKKEGTGHKEE